MKRERERERGKKRKKDRICKFSYERMKIYDIPNFNPLLYDAIKHPPPPPPLK